MLKEGLFYIDFYILSWCECVTIELIPCDDVAHGYIITLCDALNSLTLLNGMVEEYSTIVILLIVVLIVLLMVIILVVVLVVILIIVLVVIVLLITILLVKQTSGNIDCGCRRGVNSGCYGAQQAINECDFMVNLVARIVPDNIIGF